MRCRDHLALARHSRRRGFDSAFVLVTAAAVAALCFSGAILTHVRGEKSAPCELAVTAPGWLTVTEQSVQDFRAIAHVVDAAGVVEAPATVRCGKYTAGLTLVGIDGDYLDGLVYITGDRFPDGGAMPWIVLSRAAAQSFVDPEGRTKRSASYMPDIDWLGAEFSLEMGDRTVSARISGLFESDEPAAYVSRDMARALLQSQGLPDRYAGARVRVTDTGAAQAVSQAIGDLGYQVEDRDSARQQTWDSQTREAVYLAILAGAGFLCGGLFRLTGAALDREQARCREDALRWAGMSEAAIRGVGVLRGVYLALLGGALGAAAHYLTAALVGLDGETASSFALKLPLPRLIWPVGLCVGAGLLLSPGKGPASRDR